MFGERLDDTSGVQQLPCLAALSQWRIRCRHVGIADAQIVLENGELMHPIGTDEVVQLQEIDPLVNISAATVANPTEITTNANHGLTTGNVVMFRDCTGITVSGTVLNDTYYPATVTAANKITVPMNVTASSSPTGKVYYTNASSGAHRTILGYETFCEALVGMVKFGSQAYSYSLTNGVGNSRSIRTARS